MPKTRAIKRSSPCSRTASNRGLSAGPRMLNNTCWQSATCRQPLSHTQSEEIMKRVLTCLMITAFVCAGTVYAQIPAPQTQNPAAPPAKKDEDCGCEVKLPEGRAAIVNGIKVTVEEIDAPIKDKIKDLQDQIIESRKNEVDLLINARLLDIEAKKRGITAEKILQTEVEGKLVEPTDAEAQRFYQQNA